MRPSTPDVVRATALLRLGFQLEYVTLGWNVIGTVLVVQAAIATRSVALAGFGLDSLIEIFASLVVVWQLAGVSPDRERRALRLIGGAFVALALYVLVQSISTLVTRAHPAPSGTGIGWLAATLIAMVLLAWGKHRTGQALDNPVLLAESHVTLIDAYLAAAVLLGLILNAGVGWWWADPLAGLVIVYYGFKEGRAAWQAGRGRTRPAAEGTRSSARRGFLDRSARGRGPTTSV